MLYFFFHLQNLNSKLCLNEPNSILLESTQNNEHNNLLVIFQQINSLIIFFSFLKEMINSLKKVKLVLTLIL